MFEILIIVLVLASFLTYKFRSAVFSGLVVLVGFLIALYLERYEEATAILLASSIAFFAEVYKPEELLIAIILSTILSRAFAFIYALEIANLLFLAIFIETIFYAIIVSSIFTYSIVLFVLLVVAENFVQIPRANALEGILLILIVVGLFIPGLPTKNKAYYGGELDRPVTINLGGKVTIEQGAKVRTTDFGYIVDGKILIELRDLGIIRSGPAIITGVSLPVRKSKFSKSARIDELFPIERVKAGPVDIIELVEADYISIGPIKIKEKYPQVLGTNWYLVPKKRAVVFKSPEGLVEVSEKLKADTIIGYLESNDEFVYRGKYGSLKASIKDKSIEGYVMYEGRILEFSTTSEGILVNGNSIDWKDALELFIKIREWIFSKVSEELSD